MRDSADRVLLARGYAASWYNSPMLNVLLLVIVIALGIALAPYILGILGGILSIALAVLALWVGFIALRALAVPVGRWLLVPVVAVRRTRATLNRRLTESRLGTFIDRRRDNLYRRHPFSRGVFFAVYSILVPGILGAIALALGYAIHLLTDMI